MHYTLFATTYGSSQYDTNTYNGANISSGGSASGSSAGGSAGGPLLTNTGFDIAVVVTLTAVIALTAVIVRFVRRPAKES